MVATPLGQGRPGSPSRHSGTAPSSAASAAPLVEPVTVLADCPVSIEDGLLMVFGPEGDPLPPAAVDAALSADPEARLTLDNGTEVSAKRVMAVLQAQMSGHLGPDGRGSNAWLGAMLGLGPQPEEVAEAALEHEADGGQLSAYGNELLIALPGGGALLITEAKAPRAPNETIGLFLADGSAIGIGGLLERLRGIAAASGDRDEHPSGSAGREVELPDCLVQADDGSLALEFQGLGRVRLSCCDAEPAGGPQVAVFFPDGRAASMADILAMVNPSRGGAAPGGAIAPQAASDKPAGGSFATRAETADAPAPPESTAIDRRVEGRGIPRTAAAPAQIISLSANLPRIDGFEAEQLALVVVRGVPRGGALSAGLDNGDGSWLISPADLDHLALSLAPDALRPAFLPLAAIAVTSADGALTAVSGSLRLSSTPSFGRKPFGRRGAQASADQPLRLDLADRISGIDEVDAIVIRGVPPRAKLSAGTHDEAIGGWVLRPGQLERLELVPAPDQPTHFTLTILGIALRPGAPKQPRVLGQLPVALI